MRNPRPMCIVSGPLATRGAMMVALAPLGFVEGSDGMGLPAHTCEAGADNAGTTEIAFLAVETDDQDAVAAIADEGGWALRMHAPAMGADDDSALAAAGSPS